MRLFKKKVSDLNCKVEIYVPATQGVDMPVDNALEVAKIATFLAQTFGGASSHQIGGYWWSDNLRAIVAENTTIVYAFATKKALRDNLNGIFEMAQSLKERMEQEAIMVTINGTAYFQ